MTCVIAGDSIAVGTATAEGLKSSRRPPCTMDAKIGIPSAQVIGRIHGADLLVVSAGSNDPDNPKLEQNLRAIRAKATGEVLWIVPVNERAASIVKKVAAVHHDGIISFTPGRDGLHPRSYAPIIAEVNRLIAATQATWPCSQCKGGWIDAMTGMCPPRPECDK